MGLLENNRTRRSPTATFFPARRGNVFQTAYQHASASIKRLRLTQPRAARSLTTAIVAIVLFLLVLSRLEASEPPPPPPAEEEIRFIHEQANQFLSPDRPDCPSPSVRHLLSGKLNLTREITYTKRCVKPVISSSIDRNDVQNVTDSLFNTRDHINLTSCEPVHLDKCEPIQLNVPHPYPKTTYPHLMFGVATSFDRFEESISTFASWLSGSNSKLVGIVTDAYHHERDLDTLEAQFREAGMDARFFKPRKPTYSVSQNHFTILRDLVAEAKPETEWIGILDDDTFFPSLHKLSVALSQFDHTKHAYVGALSEDFKAVRTFGYMAFGGAGMFVSSALAVDLDAKVDQCLVEAKTEQGDGLLRDCVYRHSQAKLTQLPGLQQMDLNVDATGYYEGGPSPLSLHHWKSWYQSPVAEMSKVCHVCGDCFLQRWRLGEDTVLTNGYSIAQYRDDVLSTINLDQMEATWSGAEWGYEFSIGPLRPRVKPEDKKDFKLMDAYFLDDGRLRQVYVFRDDRSDADDEVVELLWDAPKSGLLSGLGQLGV